MITGKFNNYSPETHSNSLTSYQNGLTGFFCGVKE
jgi:hypothetical protein